MTVGRWDIAEQRCAPDVPDVVAGLIPGPSAVLVARAAVREAVARGARVRFVQVAMSTTDHDAETAETFAAALKALRESPGVPVSFETVSGEPGPLLVERSRGAGLLVVGGDDDGEMHALALYSTEHAACDVLAIRPARVPAA